MKSTLFGIIVIQLLNTSVYGQVFTAKDLENEERWSLYQHGQEIDGVLMLDSAVLGKGSKLIAGDPPPNSQYYGYIIRDHIDVSMFSGASGAMLALFGASGPTYFNTKLYNTELIVDKLYIRKDKKDGYNYIDVWGHINGVDTYQGYFTIQNLLSALAKEEVLFEHYITRENAIMKLKEAKELFDLELYTREQYDSIKTYLTPLIKPN
jgi:hypothetical protein